MQFNFLRLVVMSYMPSLSQQHESDSRVHRWHDIDLYIEK